MAPGYTRLTATYTGGGTRPVRQPGESGGAEGEVIEVFDRTAYLEVGPDDSVILLGTAAVRKGPLLVRTGAGPDVSFRDLVSPGDRCRMLDGQGPTVLAVGPSLTVVIPPDCDGPPPEPDGPSHPLHAVHRGGPVWNRARDMLGHACSGGAGDGLGWLDALEAPEGLPPRPRATVDAWIDVLEPAADPAYSMIQWLLGRGPGATPSGDDILAGMALALVHTTAGEQRQRVRGAIRTVLADGPGTTTMSAALLEQAARGRAPAPVRDALDVLLTGGDAAQAAAAMDDIGHHSGPDALAGMLTVLLHVGPRLDGPDGS